MKYFVYKFVKGGWFPIAETRFKEDAELIMRVHPQGFITDERGEVLSQTMPFQLNIMPRQPKRYE